MATRAGIEFRAALVLYGGVSLAVYESGVSAELLRFVKAGRGEGPPEYRELLQALEAPFTVDVIAGTSAGGINGVFLGRALATGAELKPLAELWQNEGDFEVLTDWGKEEPRSVLNGNTFLQRLRAALHHMPPGQGPLVEDLDLFIHATDLRGTFRQWKDALGHTVLGRRHLQTFHFTRRDLASPDPTEDARIQKTLARVSRTTASFPGAFEPVDCRDDFVQEPGEVPDSRKQVWMADGGILANHPFEPVLETIFRRQARKPVERLLLYVEPSLADPALPGETDSPQPDALDVLRAALEIPMYQGIEQHLRQIERHQQSLAHIDQVRQSFLERLGELHRESYAATEPYRLYLRFRLHNQETDLRQRLLIALVGAGHTEKEAAAAVKATFRQAARDGLRTEAEIAASLDRWDVAYERRRLYALIEHVYRKYIRAGLTPEVAAVNQQLWDAFHRLDEVERQVWSATRDRSATPGAILNDLQTELTRWRSALQEVIPPDAAPVTGVPGDLTEFYAHYDALDMLLYPLTVGTDLQRRDPIAWVRVSPADADTIFSPDQSAVPPISLEERSRLASRKLAGDTLMNFSGFLSWRWRANDFMWGRLDAADIVISTLTRQAVEQLGRRQYSVAQQRRIRALAERARLTAFRAILRDHLLPNERQALAEMMAQRYPDRDRLMRELDLLQSSLAAALSESTAGKALAVVGEALRALAALQAQIRADDEVVAQRAEELRNAWQSLAKMLAPAADGGPAAQAVLPAQRAATAAWQPDLYANLTWSDLHAFLMGRYGTGREGIGDLTPAVPAHVGIKVADNTRRVVEGIIGRVGSPVQPIARKAAQWLGRPVKWAREVLLPLIRRPAIGQDDRRSVAATWLLWLVPLLLLVGPGLVDRIGWGMAGVVFGLALSLVLLVSLVVLTVRSAQPARLGAGSARSMPVRWPSASVLFWGLMLLAMTNPAWLKWEVPFTPVGIGQVLRVLGGALVLAFAAVFTYRVVRPGPASPVRALGALLASLLAAVTLAAGLMVVQQYAISQSDGLPDVVKASPAPEAHEPVIAGASDAVHAPDGIAPAADGRFVVTTRDGYVLRHDGRGAWTPMGTTRFATAAAVIPDGSDSFLLVGREAGQRFGHGGLYRWQDDNWVRLVAIDGEPDGLAAHGDTIYVSTNPPFSQVWQINRKEPGYPATAIRGPLLGTGWAGANGLAVRQVDAAFYLLIAETYSGRIWQVPVDHATGHIAWRTVRDEVARVPWFPDGLLVLADGRVAAGTNGGAIWLIDPAKAKVTGAMQLADRRMAPANLMQDGSVIRFAGLGQFRPLPGAPYPGADVVDLPVPPMPK